MVNGLTKRAALDTARAVLVIDKEGQLSDALPIHLAREKCNDLHKFAVFDCAITIRVEEAKKSVYDFGLCIIELQIINKLRSGNGPTVRLVQLLEGLKPLLEVVHVRMKHLLQGCDLEIAAHACFKRSFPVKEDVVVGMLRDRKSQGISHH